MTDASCVIAPRPYALRNQIQPYAWGTRGDDAFIPNLLGRTPQPDTPYAELWMGTHPKAPSQVVVDAETTMPLDQWIASDPEAALGASIVGSFNGLPFLFKVLSAGQSLSIQAHPNKEQAKRLHAGDPEHYPDDNHKPEIAVALDHLSALMGFRPYGELRALLARYPEIAQFAGDRAGELLPGDATGKDAQTAAVRALFEAMIRRSIDEPEALARAVDGMADRLDGAPMALDERDERFLSLRDRYGSGDIGLFALYLFNLVHLDAGEGMFTQAGVPHAYLEGTIIECMANSDNVVRVGLTPKFRDAGALLEIVDPTPSEPQILTGVEDPAVTPLAGKVHAEVYVTPAPEFEIRRVMLEAGAVVELSKVGRPAVFLVTDGSVVLTWPGGVEPAPRGASYFLPACMSKVFVRSGEDAEVFVASVP
jgi:mannose-6-phosphate isomerase